MTSDLERRMTSSILVAVLLLVSCQNRVPSTVQEVPRIGPQELKARLDAGEDVVVVDARSREAFEESHIAGALSMPPEEVEDRYDQLPRGGEIVFY